MKLLYEVFLHLSMLFSGIERTPSPSDPEVWRGIRGGGMVVHGQ